MGVVERTDQPQPVLPIGANPDWTIPQGFERYTEAEHRTWVTLFERQAEVLPGRACDAFLRGLDALDLHGQGIPDFAQLNEKLSALTGWTIVAVPGLVPDGIFFDHLANGASLRGISYAALGYLQKLARLYWYTVEFGLLETPSGLRIYGAGIVSSRTESIFALASPSPNRLGFSLERVMRTLYRIDDFQQVYFVIPSLQYLLDVTTKTDFGPLYTHMSHLPDIPIAAIEPGDRVFTLGTQDYANSGGRLGQGA